MNTHSLRNRFPVHSNTTHFSSHYLRVVVLHQRLLVLALQLLADYQFEDHCLRQVEQLVVVGVGVRDAAVAFARRLEIRLKV